MFLFKCNTLVRGNYDDDDIFMSDFPGETFGLISYKI